MLTDILVTNNQNLIIANYISLITIVASLISRLFILIKYDEDKVIILDTHIKYLYGENTFDMLDTQTLHDNILLIEQIIFLILLLIHISKNYEQLITLTNTLTISTVIYISLMLFATFVRPSGLQFFYSIHKHISTFLGYINKYILNSYIPIIFITICITIILFLDTKDKTSIMIICALSVCSTITMILYKFKWEQELNYHYHIFLFMTFSLLYLIFRPQNEPSNLPYELSMTNLILARYVMFAIMTFFLILQFFLILRLLKQINNSDSFFYKLYTELLKIMGILFCILLIIYIKLNIYKDDASIHNKSLITICLYIFLSLFIVYILVSLLKIFNTLEKNNKVVNLLIEIVNGINLFTTIITTTFTTIIFLLDSEPDKTSLIIISALVIFNLVNLFLYIRKKEEKKEKEKKEKEKKEKEKKGKEKKEKEKKEKENIYLQYLEQLYNYRLHHILLILLFGYLIFHTPTSIDKTIITTTSASTTKQGSKYEEEDEDDDNESE